MTVCAVDTCDLPVEDAHCCAGCGHRLRLALTDVPALSTELDVTLSRQSAVGHRVGSRSAGAPLPYDTRASAVAHNLRNTLQTWVRLVADEKYSDSRILPADTVSAMAGWLVSEVEYLRHHEAAVEAVTEITAAVDDARRIVDRPADRVFVGVCSAVHNGISCTESLYARPSAHEVRCRTCGATHEVAARREVLKAAVDDVLATPAEIARAVVWLGDHVRPNQITRWVQAGRLVARAHYPTESGQRPLYRIGDVLDLLLATRAA